MAAGHPRPRGALDGGMSSIQMPVPTVQPSLDWPRLLKEVLDLIGTFDEDDDAYEDMMQSVVLR